MPYKTKLTVLGVTASFALIGFIVSLLRRNKTEKIAKKGSKSDRKERDKSGRIPLQSPNGGIVLCIALFDSVVIR